MLSRRAFVSTSRGFNTTSRILQSPNQQKEAEREAYRKDLDQQVRRQEEAAKNANDSHPTLPYLPRALGVIEKPSSSEESWTERSKNYFTEAKLEERKRLLLKESRNAYYADLKLIQEHGGKTWIAPPSLIQHQRSLYFPDIKGTLLKDGRTKAHTSDILKGKISLVSIMSTRIGQEHTKSWSEPILQAHGNNPDFQFLQINSQSNPLKSWLVSLTLNNLRRQVPEELQDTYLLSSQSLETVREHLAFDNQYAAYVYLIDQDIKIRWAGAAFAQQREIDAGIKCTGELLQRLHEK